jgi:TolB protein
VNSKAALVALLLSTALASGLCAADETPYVSVGTAKTKKTIIAIPDIKGTAKESIKTLHTTLSADLAFMDAFRILEASAFVEKAGGITLGTFKLSDWTSINVDFLIKGELVQTGDSLDYELYVYDTKAGKSVLGKKYKAAVAEAKAIAHSAANDIVKTLTGFDGIFLKKIAMSCEKSGKKEIYLMDFDGTNVRQLTNHRSIAIAPAWSPDGTKIAYSLYAKGKNNVKNLDLYEFDFKTSSVRMLSNRKGINSGAAFHPDGRKIAMTMSFLGNPEIFLFDTKDKSATRLTSSFGYDVDPSWSPDGKELAFVSLRSGMPMVFKMNADGTGTQRLTFAGRYNATPSWSPLGKKIAFAGWLDGRFDIFTINPDGTNIERLTKNQGNNEDPHFSADGNILAFSSNRTGGQNIYLMNIDGTFVKRLTYGLGNCVAPKWSR